MASISKYKEYSEGISDDEWEEDAEEQEDYDKVTRCGLDDPLAMRNVDLSTRLDLLHVMMLAYDVRKEDLVAFLDMLYPKAKEVVAVEKLKKIRAKYRSTPE